MLQRLLNCPPTRCIAGSDALAALGDVRAFSSLHRATGVAAAAGNSTAPYDVVVFGGGMVGIAFAALLGGCPSCCTAPKTPTATDARPHTGVLKASQHAQHRHTPHHPGTAGGGRGQTGTFRDEACLKAGSLPCMPLRICAVHSSTLLALTLPATPTQLSQVRHLNSNECKAPNPAHFILTQCSLGPSAQSAELQFCSVKLVVVCRRSCRVNSLRLQQRQMHASPPSPPPALRFSTGLALGRRWRPLSLQPSPSCRRGFPHCRLGIPTAMMAVACQNLI